jgi:hypothetical protein
MACTLEQRSEHADAHRKMCQRIGKDNPPTKKEIDDLISHCIESGDQVYSLAVARNIRGGYLTSTEVGRLICAFLKQNDLENAYDTASDLCSFLGV